LRASTGMAYRRPSRLAFEDVPRPPPSASVCPTSRPLRLCAHFTLPKAYNRPTPSLRIASGRSVRRSGLKADHARTIAGKFSPSGRARAADGIRTLDPEVGKLARGSRCRSRRRCARTDWLPPNFTVASGAPDHGRLARPRGQGCSHVIVPPRATRCNGPATGADIAGTGRALSQCVHFICPQRQP
jgi:hypothetical protein